MRIYQDESGSWRVGDGVNQVSQVFPSEEAAKKYIEKRVRSQASFDRTRQYPGKIIPVEWLEENIHKDDGVPFCDEHQCLMELFDYEDESRYECPECKREDGEQLGRI